MCAAGLLELARRRLGRPEVGHCRGHQEHVAAGKLLLARLLELLRGDHAQAAHAGGIGQRHVRRHQGDRGPALARRFGEREAHAPGGAVADEPDAVDRLACATGGHEHVQALPAAIGRAFMSSGAALERRLARCQQKRGLD